ncbi:DUF2087 domain-containing protein [Gorillibacterium timonense]|uniref:DUF2087 domain-containing protein n=1 Tax=Gorillibacterium timonense TaxID=1689269 RepID=UPI00071D7AB8|nr:metalloregulator ArsR/SmtB family transcription factor [Gorillibacterium timonense]
MQLEKLVAFHKALSDPTRIRILRLIADGPLSGQELAGRLGVTPPTITHHMLKLREAGVLFEWREKNTIYFSLNREMLEVKAGGTVSFISPSGAEKEVTELTALNEDKFKESVLKNFFGKDGRLKTIPAQLKKKIVILEWLAEQFEIGKAYPEKEINEFLKRYHEDFATLRRELIMQQFMYREKEVYELNPREVWTNWRNLH